MKRHRVLAVALTAGVLLGSGLYAKAAALEHQRVELLTQAYAVDAQADDAEGRSAQLSGLIDAAEAETAELDGLIAVRPDFVAEVKALVKSFDEADGKVDVDDERTAAMSAQQTVLDERDDADAVIAATATVHALREKVDGEVADWDRAERIRLAAVAPTTATSTGSTVSGGFDRVRAALDRVGGSGVGLYESSSCAGGSAPACANSNGYIKYRADIAGWSEGRLNWAMAHELAHIYQFRVWGALTGSSAYQSLFGADPEFLANCMALVRGYPGSVGCNTQQQAWASGIWVGTVG